MLSLMVHTCYEGCNHCRKNKNSHVSGYPFFCSVATSYPAWITEESIYCLSVHWPNSLSSGTQIKFWLKKSHTIIYTNNNLFLLQASRIIKRIFFWKQKNKWIYMNFWQYNKTRTSWQNLCLVWQKHMKHTYYSS